LARYKDENPVPESENPLFPILIYFIKK